MESLTIQCVIILEQNKTDKFLKHNEWNYTLDTNQIAQYFLIGKPNLIARKLNQLLYVMGIQYKKDEEWVLTPTYNNKGYKTSRPLIKKGHKIKDYSCWTDKGEKFIIKYLTQNGFLLLTNATTNNQKQEYDKLNQQLLNKFLNNMNI